MTIDQAIKNLKLLSVDPGMVLAEGHAETINLAIAALVRVKGQRTVQYAVLSKLEGEN